MAKFHNRYRIESHRMPEWDYSDAGDYFLTICTSEMKCLLGEVVDGKMELNDFGKIVHEELIKSIDIRKELQLGEFVVMPNHIHAIVSIAWIETHGRASVQGCAPMRNMPYRRPKSISSFVAGYKSAVVSAVDNFIDEYGLDIPKFNRKNKLWHSNYYDHIIRDEGEYYRIAQYIKANPLNWDQRKHQKLKK